jgi:hypothetical protein
MSVINLSNSKAVNLTKEYLAPRGFQPLYVGDDTAFRFQALNGTTPVDLTGYTITAELVNDAAEASLSRSSAVTIPTTITPQIEIDSQLTIASETGRGWYQLNFASVVADVALLTPLLGRCTFGVRLISPANIITTHVTGTIDLLTKTQ